MVEAVASLMNLMSLKVEHSLAFVQLKALEVVWLELEWN